MHFVIMLFRTRNLDLKDLLLVLQHLKFIVHLVYFVNGVGTYLYYTTNSDKLLLSCV